MKFVVIFTIIGIAVVSGLIFIIGFDFGENSYYDNGDFIVTYSTPENLEYVEMEKNWKKFNPFTNIANELNKKFKLPYDLTINHKECNEINAFYDPEEKEIILCYELVDYLTNLFRESGMDEDEVSKSVAGVFLFIFFHELSHTLIDVYDIPVLGKEEDAADSFSTMLFTLKTNNQNEIALNSTLRWLNLIGENQNDELAFWDEHSLNMQRFYNIACWVSGSDNDLNLSIDLHDREQRCLSEYQDLRKNWDFYLSPHMK